MSWKGPTLISNFINIWLALNAMQFWLGVIYILFPCAYLDSFHTQNLYLLQGGKEAVSCECIYSI